MSNRNINSNSGNVFTKKLSDYYPDSKERRQSLFVFESDKPVYNVADVVDLGPLSEDEESK